MRGEASETAHSHLFTHTHTHTQSTVSQGGLRHMLRVQCYAIVPSSFPFIHSVKHDTCINSGWILELCVLTPYVFLSRALSSPITTTVSICCLASHHKRAYLFFHVMFLECCTYRARSRTFQLYCCLLYILE